MTILDFIQNNMRNDFMDSIMPIISMLGNAGAIWIITSIVFILIKKYRSMGATILIALILCVLIGNLTLKPLVARVRPCDIANDIVLLIPHPKDYSFPSGHTMSSFAASVVIFIKNRKFGFAAIILAVLISFSRLYLYVHYLSDVIAGAVIGIIIGVFSSIIFEYFIQKSRDGKSSLIG